MDCGCTVEGYQSDISRTWVFGEATSRQRKVWSTVKRGQEIALQSAKIGVAAGSIDDAVRSFYQREGWGPAISFRDSPTVRGTESDSMDTNLRFSSTAMRPRSRRACVFPMNRDSTFQASSACGSRIAGI
jgi:methionine aminopeptidase